jgi:hypothetical protein
MSDKVYDRVWKLLSDKSKWIKNCLARDNAGHTCNEEAPEAAKWCVLGAINKVYPKHLRSTEQFMRLSHAVGRDYESGLAHEWNNDPKTTHEMLVNKLKELDI